MTISSLIRWMAAVLVVAALATPVAQAGSSPSQPSTSQRTAEGFLRLAGFPKNQISSWTSGACSYDVKPSSCYMTAAEAQLASQTTAAGFQALAGNRGSFRLSPPVQRVTTVTVGDDGFNWGDAGVGSAITAGLGLLLAAGAVSVRNRRRLSHP